MGGGQMRQHDKVLKRPYINVPVVRFIRPTTGYQSAFVYALVDPENPEAIAYIGQTVVPARRYAEHVRNRTPKKVPASLVALKAWVNNMQLYGRQPKMEILESVDPRTALQAEARWLVAASSQGHPILNVGGGPCQRST